MTPETWRETRIDADLLALWLLKDLGWVLVLPFLCLPPAAVAVVFASYVTWKKWRTSSTFDFAHGLLEVVWLCGNFLWMITECFFELPPEDLPYRFTPLFSENDQSDGWGMLSSQVIFMLGLGFIVSFYASLLLRNHDVNDVSADVVHGVIPSHSYHNCFITFWVAKDLCWVLQLQGYMDMALFWLGCLFGLLSLVVLVDAGRRCLQPGFRVFVGVETFWIVGNIIWMVEECYFGDEVAGRRFLSALLILMGTCVVLPYTTAFDIILGTLRPDDPEYVPLAQGGDASIKGDVIVCESSGAKPGQP